MPTRRPKVPKAGSAPDGSGTGGDTAGRSAARSVRRKAAGADPDVISATKPVGPASDQGPRAEAAPAAKTSAAKTPAAPSAKTSAPKAAGSRAKAAGTSAGKPAGVETSDTPDPSDTPDTSARSRAAAAAGRLRQRSRILSEGSSVASASSADESSDHLRPVPAKAFSGRLLVLAMVMIVVIVLLTPSVNTYLHQRSDITALQTEIAEQKEKSATLESQLQRWEDPNYIKQQARERIFLVMPGETRYLVKGEDGVETVEQEAQEEETDLKWVDSLWDSVKRSANAP
ncbi:septum formation initiator family protein [Arthrobacter sp. NPDC097144]|uniref:FtsB family cell division protein n=1 Tax=Arthrobacter sp. NPDC097144 TaxID=3363946 RepID=UPI003803924A